MARDAPIDRISDSRSVGGRGKTTLAAADTDTIVVTDLRLRFSVLRLRAGVGHAWLGKGRGAPLADHTAGSHGGPAWLEQPSSGGAWEGKVTEHSDLIVVQRSLVFGFGRAVASGQRTKAQSAPCVHLERAHAWRLQTHSVACGCWKWIMSGIGRGIGSRLVHVAVTAGSRVQR